MKFNLFISLIVVTISLNAFKGDLITDTRNFIKGFLSSTEGKQIEIDENCLGDKFHENVNKLIEAIRKENSILVFTLLWEMKNSIEKNCPKNDLLRIYHDVKSAVDSKKIVDKVVQNSKEVMKILNELLDEKDPEKLGTIIGKLVKLLVYEKNENVTMLTFLGEDTNKDIQQIMNMSKEQIEKFLDGFLEAISSVPYSENKCKKDISAFKDDIIEVFSSLINSFRTGKNIIESFKKVYNLVLSLKPVDENCNFKYLSINLVALSTKIGIAKLTYHFTTNLSSTYKDMKEFYGGIESNNWRPAGLAFGDLVRIGLNYSTK